MKTFVGEKALIVGVSGGMGSAVALHRTGFLSWTAKNDLR